MVRAIPLCCFIVCTLACGLSPPPPDADAGEALEDGGGPRSTLDGGARRCGTWTTREHPALAASLGWPGSQSGEPGGAFFVLPSADGGARALQFSQGAWSEAHGPAGAFFESASNAQGDGVILARSATGFSASVRARGAGFGAVEQVPESQPLDVFNRQGGILRRSSVVLDGAGNAAVFFLSPRAGQYDVKARLRRQGSWLPATTLLSVAAVPRALAGGLSDDGELSLSLFVDVGGRKQLTSLRTVAGVVRRADVALPEPAYEGSGHFNAAGEGVLEVWTTATDGGFSFRIYAVAVHADGTAGAPEWLADMPGGSGALLPTVVGEDGSAWVQVLSGTETRVFHRAGPSGHFTLVPQVPAAAAFSMLAVGPTGAGYLVDWQGAVARPYVADGGFGEPFALPLRGRPLNPDLATDGRGLLALSYAVEQPGGLMAAVTSVCW